MAFSILNRKLLSATPRILQPIYSSRLLYPSSQLRSYSLESKPSNINNDIFINEPTTNLIPDIVHDLNALGEPTLSSLGLCNISPVGFIQYFMDTMHTNLDMPWWMTICTTCITVRLCMLPVSILLRRNQINMSNNFPTLGLIDNEMYEAIKIGDMNKVDELQRKKIQFMKTNGMGLLVLMPLLCQGSIFISVFWAIRGMTGLPVDSLKTGGILSFVDLTLPEPYYLLPLLTSVTVLYVLETGAEGMKMDAIPKLMKNLLRGTIIFSFFFMTQFPSAITLYWFTSNVISLTQAKLFRIKSIRQLCNLPESVEHDPALVEKLKQRQRESYNFSHMKELYKQALEEENKKNASKLKTLKNLKKSNITTYDDSTIKSKPKVTSDDSKAESIRHRDRVP